MKKTLLFFILSIFSFSALADNQTYFCSKEFESVPILQGGRVKPLFVHASEAMKQLTGKSKVGDFDAVTAYCLLSSKALGVPSEIKLLARIDHVELQKFLGLDSSTHEISYDELLPKETDIRREFQKIKEDSSYKKSLIALFNNIFLYNEISKGENWLLAEDNGADVAWNPITVYLTEAKINAQKELTPTDPFAPVILKSKTNYLKIKNDKYLLELTYAKLHLPIWALVLTLLALGALVIFNKANISLILAGSTVLVQTIFLVMRIMISGRAPITNMYETVLFSGYGALVLALILGHFKKQTVFIYMGLAYNVCTLMMLNFANGMLTATISPLVPVLRDNFWLSTHVTTIILSYGALALSWILANTVLVKRRMGTITSKDDIYYSEIIYTTLKWGTTMLAAGIILGGVWADYSWGRFWGWDPKETWSLIVLCFYMAILHGRYTSWIKPHRFIMVTALAFLSVMMAWFGVNYILASGLHSYGFSQGGALFLATFFILQIGLVLATYKKQIA